MGSYPGQQDRLRSPFGYVLSNVHGVGLPPFITPGPPPGQPLLNDNDSQNLNSFFNDFESNILHANTQTFDGQHHQDDRHLDYNAPPVFVGSETHLDYGSSVNPRRLQPGTYAQSMLGQNMSMLPHEGSFDHGLESSIPGYMDPSLEHGQQLHNQFQDMQAPPRLHQSYSQQYEPGMMQPFVNGRPAVRWGSDGHFQQSGYDAPSHQQEPDMINNLDWIEAQSSANNTAPNSRPITQPSSPNMSRKRKFADELFPPHSMANAYGHDTVTGTGNSTGIPKSATSKAAVAKRKKSMVKEEQAASETAASPAPWPSNKARPVSKPPVSKKASNRGRRKVEEGTPDNIQGPVSSKPAPKSSNKLKATKKKPTKSAARSLARSSITPATGRTPLTSDQKKANHTNSEQRRRDQTGQAYARMYDLVPQLAEMGKMSTTRKLEVVVNRLRDLQDGNAQLRANLGL